MTTEVEFSARQIGLQAANLFCDAYTEAKERYAKEPKKSPLRGDLALDIQREKKGLDRMVADNRRHFKCIQGDKQ